MHFYWQFEDCLPFLCATFLLRVYNWTENKQYCCYSNFIASRERRVTTLLILPHPPFSILQKKPQTQNYVSI